jgi:hypothetical protein
MIVPLKIEIFMVFVHLRAGALKHLKSNPVFPQYDKCQTWLWILARIEPPPPRALWVDGRRSFW